MKKEKFYDLLGNIDEDLIKSAEEPPAKKPEFTWVKYAAAAAACIAIFIGAGALHRYSDADISITSDTGMPITSGETPPLPIETYASSVSTESFTMPPVTAEPDPSAPVQTGNDTAVSTAADMPPETAVTVPSVTAHDDTNTVTTADMPPEAVTETAPPAETSASVPESEKTETEVTYPPLSPENYISDSNMIRLASAKYPEMPKYPGGNENDDTAYEKWSDAKIALRHQPAGYDDGFDEFFKNSTSVFLKNKGTNNSIYSPLSLYMALGMSAEISGGNTRQQILDVLVHDDIDVLRSHAHSVWQANYMDDGMAKCTIATSLWMNDDLSYNMDTVERLAGNYYSSVYSGNPASYEYNKLLQDWIAEQTGGILKDQLSKNIMSPEMALTIASTVSFKGKWSEEFSKDLTGTGTFHSPNGDIERDFMNKETFDCYYWGDNFSSVSLGFEENGKMLIILPDEGTTPEKLLDDEQIISYMTDPDKYKNNKYLTINMSIPKFDVSSNLNLTDGLEKMGITDAFDISRSDFTPLTEDTGVFLSSAKQSTRVIIDEEGCKASSMTMIAYAGAGEPSGDYVDFIADRPFIFEIISDTGLPLFVGIVNKP